MEKPKILKAKKCPPPGFLPSWLFERRSWRNKFKIPKTKLAKIRLYHKLEGYSRYGIMRMPGYEKIKQVLDERVRQLGVLLGYTRDEVQMKNVPPSLLCKEYGERNFLVPSSRQLCEERLAYLIRCSDAADAAVLLKPAYRKNSVALRREIAALDACLSIPE